MKAERASRVLWPTQSDVPREVHWWKRERLYEKLDSGGSGRCQSGRQAHESSREKIISR